MNNSDGVESQCSNSINAQGNVMSTYDQTGADSSLSFKLLEEHLYGSSRLGMVSPNKEMIGADTTAEFAYDTLNKRQYELSNHLDNVLTTVSDRKIGLDVNHIVQKRA